MEGPTVTHEPDGHRGAFVIRNGDRRLAAMTYSMAGETVMMIDHTDVDASLRGTGAGKRLVEAAVDWARAEGRQIIPVCPFARSVFDKMPEFRDVLK
jgi:uncharacterized protein